MMKILNKHEENLICSVLKGIGLEDHFRGIKDIEQTTKR